MIAHQGQKKMAEDALASRFADRFELPLTDEPGPRGRVLQAAMEDSEVMQYMRQQRMTALWRLAAGPPPHLHAA